MAATHIRALEFGEVSEPQLEFEEEPGQAAAGGARP
jgi:hypothetical protein